MVTFLDRKMAEGQPRDDSGKWTSGGVASDNVASAEDKPSKPSKRSFADIRAEIRQLREEIARRDENVPNLRDYGLEKRPQYEADVAAYHAHTAALNARMQALGYESVAARQREQEAQIDAVKTFDPSQERDDSGRWTSGAGAVTAPETTSKPKAAAQVQAAEDAAFAALDTPTGKLETGALKDSVCQDLSSRLEGNRAFQDFVKRDEFQKPIVSMLDLTDKSPTYQATSALLQNWAGTSGDTEPQAVALQRAVQDEFDLPTAKMDHMQAPEEDVDRIYQKDGPAMKAFARAMYDNTQATFKQAGITEMLLYRGMGFDKISEATAAGVLVPGSDPLVRTTTVAEQPMSSWAYDPESAISFSTIGRISTVMASVVPAARILSTAATGIGCRTEAEVVVLGTGSDQVNYFTGSTGALDRSNVAQLFRPGRFLNDRKPAVPETEGKAAAGQPYNIDGVLKHADWAKAKTWDVYAPSGKLANTLELLHEAMPLKSDVELQHLLDLPSAVAMPSSLKAELQQAKRTAKLNPRLQRMLKAHFETEAKTQPLRISHTVAEVRRPDERPEAKAFDPSQPRDDSGKWTSAGGGLTGATAAHVDTSDASRAVSEVPHTAGHAYATGTLKDPIYVDGNLDQAAREIFAGHHVRLDQPRQVATLVDKLGDMAEDAVARGEKAPTYNLGLVTVPGTNLFTQESLGIPRVEMPQLTGVPLPGTPADSLPKNAKGNVNLGEMFRDELEKQGFTVTDERIPAENLRATQMDLVGPQVAGMADALEAGRLHIRPIYVSQDDYVVDGHHQWAATVLANLRAGRKQFDIPVQRVHTDIGTILDTSREYTTAMGLPAKAGLAKMLELLTRRLAQIEQKFRASTKMAENQARDENGRWTLDGSSDGSSELPDYTAAGTPEDAEAFTRSLPGIANVEGAQATPVETQNVVNHGLHAMANLGYPMPKTISYEDRSDDQGLVAEMHLLDDKLVVNRTGDYWKDPSKNAARAKTVGRSSNNRPDGPIMHELGHKLHFMNAPSSPNVRNFQSIMEVDPIVDHVSSYAADSPSEFVAEVFSGIQSGERYPPVIKNLYDKYRGPPIPWVLGPNDSRVETGEKAPSYKHMQPIWTTA